LSFATQNTLLRFLKDKGISDVAVLDVMLKIPRHLFVAPAFTHQVYLHNALPISCGQTISHPYMVAKMIELLKIDSPQMKILEIGTGSGYQTAILSQLVTHLYSVERIKKLQLEAKRRLKLLDIYNVSTKHGDGWYGWQSKAPFDAIIVSAAAENIPQALLEQLNKGGRLVIPVGQATQELKCITKLGDTFLSENIEPVNFVPLVPGELA